MVKYKYLNIIKIIYNMDKESLINCEKVYVKNSNDKGMSAFANYDIKQGELIEKGIARRVDTDGNKNPYLFTWSDDRTIWAFVSGCTTFYNTSRNPNTKMIRYFDENRFEIVALKDIKKGDELTHQYKSLEWRECFDTLRSIKDL
jgi:uncharacterized protein